MFKSSLNLLSKTVLTEPWPCDFQEGLSRMLEICLTGRQKGDVCCARRCLASVTASREMKSSGRKLGEESKHAFERNGQGGRGRRTEKNAEPDMGLQTTTHSLVSHTKESGVAKSWSYLPPSSPISHVCTL